MNPIKLISFAVTLFCVVHLYAQQTDSVPINGVPYQLYWENKPLSFTNNAGQLTITAGPKTDMFRDPNVTYNTDNAPKLVFHPDEDFVLSASISHAFASKWDGGAIILKQDSLNWIKFCFEKDYTGSRRVVSVVTKNISDDCNSIQINSNKVFYKLAKAGKVITLYCSQNGKSWYLVRHFQFEVTNKIMVGFLAQSPEGAKCEVRFGDIRYEAKKIKDPYLGE